MPQQTELIPADDVARIRERFENRRYVGVRGLVDPSLAAMLYQHVRARAAANTLSGPKTPGMPSAVEGSGEPLMENVLKGLLPRVEELAGAALYPTYSFVRLYRRGDRLDRHHDRPACEISVSLHLGGESERPWPLWIAAPDGRASGITLSVADAALYRGIECEHWREPFEGAEWAQLFLHYVEREGRYAGLKLDGRPETAY